MCYLDSGHKIAILHEKHEKCEFLISKRAPKRPLLIRLLCRWHGQDKANDTNHTCNRKRIFYALHEQTRIFRHP